MTKEELEKEAEDFLKKSLKVDDDLFDFFKNEASCKEEIKRLTDFVEPREKRIEILEKENAELKDKLEILISVGNTCTKGLHKQLTKAKEIIKDYLTIVKGSHTTVCGVPEENRTIYVLKLNEEAEQLIREVQ